MVGKIPNSQTGTNQPADHRDYLMLISLALDEMLEPHEQQQLDRHLDQCDSCRQQWTLWQVIDQHLRATPAPQLSPAFAQRVGTRMRQQEQRRHLRVGLLLTTLTVLVWLLGLAGVGLLAAFLIYANLGWFAQTLQFLTFAWTAVSIVGRSLWDVFLGLLETPTALGAATLYFVLSILALTGWFRFLQRSVQPLEPQA